MGGFDATLRFGEDVDLVWRLDAAGWRVRYEPASTVLHDPRRTVGAWARQRSATDRPQHRWPTATRVRSLLLRMNRWSAAAWGAAVVSPTIGVAIAGATTAMLARQVGRASSIRGGLPGGWPASAISSPVGSWRRRSCGRGSRSPSSQWSCHGAARVVTGVAVIGPPLVAWVRDRPGIDPVRAVGLHIADDLVYGAGLWRGMARERSLAAIRPVLTAD